MSIITRMLEKIYPKTEHRVLFVGLDSSGRTTALYKMKLGEVVTTIPTIGFNVETIEHKGIKVTVWDVGGCDKIRPLWRHYYQNTDAVVFFFDSCDKERFDEAVEEMGRLLSEDELRDSALLVWANKQDLPNAMTLDEITERAKLNSLVNRRWHIQGASAKTGAGLWEGMDWLLGTLSGKQVKDKGTQRTDRKDPAAQDANPLSKEEEAAKKQEELLTEWLEREDEDDDAFLAKLHDFTLETWDHRTHLRIAWLILSRHGRKAGMPIIFDGIKNFIEKSDRTKRSRGTTFHETMTYFWVHMVHYAIEATKNPTGDFKGFLLMNPQLSNGGLFLHYYSKQVMLLSPESRIEVVLPDKVPLPSLIGGAVAASDGQSIEKRFSPAKPMDDEEFFLNFQQKSLPSWGHEPRLRVIWKLLCQRGRERGGTNYVLDSLKAAEGSGHNMTVAYFWIQMVTFCMAKVGEAPTYAHFIQRPECQMLLNPDLIDKHYSDQAIKRGFGEFTVPDKKPLPSVVR